MNNTLTIYTIIMHGGFMLLYAGIAVWSVRTVLRQKTILHQILVTIIVGVLLPVIISFVIVLLYLGGLNSLLSIKSEEWAVFFAMITVYIIFIHFPILIGIGYCWAYPLHKDLIKENKVKRDVDKKRQIKCNWNIIDFRILGTVMLIAGVVIYLSYIYHLGTQNAEKQEDFMVVTIEENTYAVIMTDGDYAVVEKCKKNKNGDWELMKDEFMRIDCEGLLMKKYQFKNDSLGDK